MTLPKSFHIAERAARCVPWYAYYKDIYRVASEVEKEGQKVTYLEIAVPHPELPVHVLETVKTSLKHLTKTPSVLGSPELRKTIAEKIGRENKIVANTKSEILVTVGAMQALNAAMQAIIDPGDQVLLTSPGYDFRELIRLAGGSPIYVPLEEEKKFIFEPEKFERIITPRTKAIVINTPHNPTGHVARLNELEGIAEIAQKHDLLVVSDEVFDNFVYDGLKHYSIASLPRMKKRTITINSFSKNYGLYHWRIGYLVADENLMKYIKAIHAWTISFHAPVVQAAALAALTGPQDWVKEMVDEFRQRRDLAVRELRAPYISFVKPEGGITIFLNVSKLGLTSDRLAEYLVKQARVVTSPGIAWLKEGYIRVSLTCPSNQLRQALQRIREALERLRKQNSDLR